MTQNIETLELILAVYEYKAMTVEVKYNYTIKYYLFIDVIWKESQLNMGI